jgi:hypothetical protein
MYKYNIFLILSLFFGASWLFAELSLCFSASRRPRLIHFHQISEHEKIIIIYAEYSHSGK